MRWIHPVTDGYLAYCIGNLLDNVVSVAHTNNGTTCWERSADINDFDFDFEPARLSAAHLGAGETSETNIKV